ncbi:MAG: hypothetical protein AAF399_10700, partial [Bacteroidota bacterium]
ILQLEDGHWLSWEWEEEGKEEPEFIATYGKQDPRWEDPYVTFQAVLDTQNWQKLTQQRLLRVETRHLPSARQELGAMVLHFSHQSIVICGMPEPESFSGSSSWRYEFAPEWTGVIFEVSKVEEVLRQSWALPEDVVRYPAPISPPRQGPVRPGPAHSHSIQ